MPNLLPQEIIRRKRDGSRLEADEIGAFIEALGDGHVSEAQAAALMMAVYFQGMDGPETASLTTAMTASGRKLDWQGLHGPVLDKHSTGGIGDKVSLVLAPILAAAGAHVPMISGRGLGHTGGTLDKLESLEGYATLPDLARFQAVVREVGCAIIGAGSDLAPADRALYALRDVTATVDSRPLIVASILSKKLAAGLDGLVMDVKVGSGAFLPSIEAAKALADNLVEVAGQAGLACRALLTDMNQCLGRSAGNALEVGEAIACLRGEPVEPRLEAVTIGLAAMLLHMGGLAPSKAAGEARARALIADGSAADRFARMVEALGGPAGVIDRPEAHLPRAPIAHPIVPRRPGFLASIDVRALGLAIIGLGGGRRLPTDRIDHAVGLADVRSIGDPIGPDTPFAMVHARTEAAADAAVHALEKAFTVCDHPVSPSSPLLRGP